MISYAICKATSYHNVKREMQRTKCNSDRIKVCINPSSAKDPRFQNCVQFLQSNRDFNFPI